MTSCEQKSDLILDSRDIAPLLLTSWLSPATVNTDTINVGPERKPDDVLPIILRTFARVIHLEGNAGISSVTLSVYRERQSLSVASAVMHDNGLLPDAVSGDSLFSAEILLQIPRTEIGVFRVEIIAESKGGSRSTSHIHPFTIVRLNQPPILSDLQAPDTVQTSAQSSFLITVKADDPDGRADITSVVRRTPSNLVLQLNDSGINGDMAAGDGVFSETVSLIPPPQPGSYTFTFQAFDRSNAGSNILSHTIIVIP